MNLQNHKKVSLNDIRVSLSETEDRLKPSTQFVTDRFWSTVPHYLNLPYANYLEREQIDQRVPKTVP